MSSSSRDKLTLALFFIGLAISMASSAGYSINYIPSTYQFGLLQMLPPLFWFGFALCLVSLVGGIRRDGEKTFIIKFIMLYLLIWSIPTLFLQNPYFWDSYNHTFEAMPIMFSGHVPVLSATLPEVFTFYPAEFPGFHILLTSIFQVTNASVIPFAKFYPIFSSLVTFLAILLFFKTFLPSVSYRWALLISVLVNVYMQFHVSPQSAGLIAGILILVALEKPGLRWKSIAIVLFAFLVVSHPTTVFILLPIVVLAWLLRIALLRDVRALRDLAPLFLAMWLVWMMVHAVSLQQSMVELATAPGGAAQGTGISFLDRPIGTAGERLETIFYYAPRIRFAVLALFGLCSAYYLVTQWFSRAGRKDRNLAIYTAFIIAPVVMTVLDVTFIETDQLHDRYFLFFLLAAPILLLRLAERNEPPPMTGLIQSNDATLPSSARTKWRRLFGWKAFFPMLLLLALFNFTTTYYQSSKFVSSDETVFASNFVNSKCDSSQVIGGKLIPDLDHPYQSSTLRQTPFYHFYPQPLTDLKLPSVIIIDDHDRIWYQVQYGIEKYDFYAHADELEDSLGKVYSNSRYDIYWFEGGTG
ncbi:MAG: hypothetical protein ACE5IE_00410 [Dehalococcoidia bacterium]